MTRRRSANHAIGDRGVGHLERHAHGQGEVGEVLVVGVGVGLVVPVGEVELAHLAGDPAHALFIKLRSRQFAPHTLVNAVAPNAIRTGMTTTVFQERGDAILSTIPLGRFGEPEEISPLVTFLCGEGATYITGQTINVDGGAANS